MSLLLIIHWIIMLQAVEEETATLIAEVREHPVYETLCDALACFGYEWKDIEPAMDSAQ